MSGWQQDTWKLHARASIGDVIGALAALDEASQLDRLVAARANLEKAIEALAEGLPKKEFAEGREEAIP